MAAIRIITTDASVWTFNFTEMIFNRSPRVEGIEHRVVKYTGDWRHFNYIEESCAIGFEDERIRFTVFGPDLDGQGAEWITSTYKPTEQ